MKLKYIATVTAASILTIGGAAFLGNVATASTFNNTSTVIAGNPCDLAEEKVNPCASANPCAAEEKVNPCASANPCAAEEKVNPCASANPCAAEEKVNPCASANPCAGK